MHNKFIQHNGLVLSSISVKEINQSGRKFIYMYLNTHLLFIL